MEDPNLLEGFKGERIVALRYREDIFKVFYRQTSSDFLKYFADVNFKKRSCRLRDSSLDFNDVRCLEYLLTHFKSDSLVDGMGLGIRGNDLPSITIKSRDLYTITDW